MKCIRISVIIQNLFKIKIQYNKSKKKKSKLMEIAVNTTRNEKYKKHKKSASVLDNDSKFFHNIFLLNKYVIKTF